VTPIVTGEVAVEVGVLHDQDPALGDSGPHAVQQAVRLAQVVQQEPRIHGVMAAGLVPVPDIDCGELNVAQPPLPRCLPGQAG
jgi:hypothetical protein